MNILDRPYRDKRVITARKETVVKEKAARKARERRAERLKDRCLICGDSSKVVQVRIGSSACFCQTHFSKLLTAFHSFVEEETDILAKAKELPTEATSAGV